MKGNKVQLQAFHEVCTGTEPSIKQHRYYFWKNQIVQRIYPHNLQGIDLFRYPHGANTGGDIGTHLTGHNDRGEGWGKFKYYGLSGGKPDKVPGNQWIGNVQGGLYGNYASYKKGNENNDSHGTVNQFVYFL